MGTKRIKGITIELNGDATGLDKALKGLDKQLNQTESSLKDVNRLLKLDPGNTELLRQKQELLQGAIKDTKERLDALKAASEQAAKTAGGYDAWKNAYAPIQEEIGKTGEKIKGLKESMAELEKAGKVDSSEYKALGEELKNTEGYLKELKQKARDVSEEFGNPISHEQYDALQREIIETEQELKRLQDAAVESRSALVKLGEAGEKLEGAGDSVSGTGKKLGGLTTAIGGAGLAAVKTAADFDSAMSQVAAVSGASGDELLRLRDKAREMGEKTKFSASEAAEAMNYMAMAGWKTEDMLAGIEGVMSLAAASGESLATTSDIVTDAMTAFGLSAADSGHFSDILAQASSNANTNVAMMGETFKYVAPVAGTLGYSAEDAALAIGLMANAGIKGSQAGTSLRSIMSRMAKPTKESADAMYMLGVSITDEEGQMYSLMEVLEQLRQGFAGGRITQEEYADAVKEWDRMLADGSVELTDYTRAMDALDIALNGTTEAQQAELAAMLGGQEAMSGLLAIVNASESDFGKLERAVYSCDGAAGEMAEVMNDNLAGQITILMSKLQELAISFGGILMPVIRDIVGKIQGFVDKLNGMDEGTKRTIAKISLLVAAIGPFLVILGTVISKVGTAMKGFSGLCSGIGKTVAGVRNASGIFGKLGAALGGISAPVVAVVAVIGTLVAAFVHLWNTNEEFRDNIIGIWERIKSVFSGFVEGIQERLSAFGISFEDITGALGAVWDGFCSLLAPVFEGAFGAVATVLETVAGILTGLLDVFIGVFTGNWQQAWDGLGGIFQSAWDGITGLLEGAFSTLTGMADVVCGWFGTTWGETWAGVQETAVSVWTAVTDFFAGIPEWWTGIWTSVGQFFDEAWNAILENPVVGVLANTIMDWFANVRDTLSGIWEGIRDTASGAWELIKNVILGPVLLLIDLVTLDFEKLREDAQNIWNNIKDAAGLIWEGTKQLVGSLVKGLVENARILFEGFRDTVRNIFKAVKDFITDTVSGIKDKAVNGFKNMVKGIRDAIKNIGDTVKEGFKSAIEFITALPSQALQWGSDFINGMKDGIMRSINGILDAVRSLADGIRALLHFSRPDEGPLREYEKWMPDFMRGMADGIVRNTDLIRDAVMGVADVMVLDLQPMVQYESVKLGSNGMKEAMRGMPEQVQGQPIYQEINVNQPCKSPVEMGREMRRIGKELAFAER
jgi:phage-related protein